jgi:hypothetical protein
VHLGADPLLAENDVEDRLFQLLHRAQIAYDVKAAVLDAATARVPLASRLSRLQALGLAPALETAVCELLLARTPVAEVRER